MNLEKEIKKLNKSIISQSKLADKAIDLGISKIQGQLSPEDFEKWRDITGRIMNARLKNDNKMVESLTNDLNKLINGE